MIITILSIVFGSITIGLLAASWRTVSPHEFGIKFSEVTWKMDADTIYNGERAYVGPGGHFITFPRKLQYVEATGPSALDVWSADGQNLFLEISFYYGLRSEKIFDIYYQFNQDFDSVIRKIAFETVRDCATDFETIDFFTKRGEIDSFISHRLADRLYLEAHANMTMFNLLAIDVPDRFENAVVQTLITAQDVNTLAVLRTSAVYKTDMAVVAAQAEANITLINARADATGTLLLKKAEADFFELLQSARAESLSQLATDLGFSGSAEVLQYLYTDIIRGKTAASGHSVAFGVDRIQVGSKAGR